MLPTDLINKCAGHSLLGTKKLSILYAFLTMAEIPPSGSIVELGVYKGGSAMLLAEMFPDKQLFVYDTFEGMPLGSDDEIHKMGDFGDTSLEQVKNTLKDYKNIVYEKGRFPGTAKGFDIPISIAFCDADYYQSTKDFIDLFWTKLEPGGIMIFDDFNWPHCPGVCKAIQDSPCLLGYKQWVEDYLYFVVKI